MPGFASPWGGIKAVLLSRAHVSMHRPYGTRHKLPQTTTTTTTTTTTATTTSSSFSFTTSIATIDIVEPSILVYVTTAHVHRLAF